MSVCMYVCYSLKSRKVPNRFSSGFRYCIRTRLQSNMGHMRFLKTVSFAHNGGRHMRKSVFVCLFVCFSLKSRKVPNQFSSGFRYCIRTQLQSNMGDMRFFKSVSFAHSGGQKCAEKRFLALTALFLEGFSSYLEYRQLLRLDKTQLRQIFDFFICAGEKAFNCVKRVFLQYLL